MAAAGIHPSVVAQRMGHTSPAMTLEFYTFALLEMRRDGVDRIAEILEADAVASVTSA